MTTQALTRVEEQVIAASEMEIAEVKAHVIKIQHLMQSVMQVNQHYGTIPGTPKPSLWKPGAEKLCLTFRLDPQYDVVERTEEEAFIAFTVRCTLYHMQTTSRVASGLGSCNTRESQYRTKTAGGKTWDLHNTVLKMACKRALVAAVLNGTAASDIFTQDLEDLEANGVAVGQGNRRAPVVHGQQQRPMATGNGRAPVARPPIEGEIGPAAGDKPLGPSGIVSIDKLAQQAGLLPSDLDSMVETMYQRPLERLTRAEGGIVAGKLRQAIEQAQRAPDAIADETDDDLPGGE